MQETLHSCRRLLSVEEELLSAATNLALTVLRLTSTVTIFAYDSANPSPMVIHGNRECRKELERIIFTRNKAMQDALFAILIYDVEAQSCIQKFRDCSDAPDLDFTDENTKREKVQYKVKERPRMIYLDLVRQHIVEFLGECFRVDDGCMYSFIDRYSVAKIRGDTTLSLMFLHALLQSRVNNQFRDRLSDLLLEHEVLKPSKAGEKLVDEYMLDHAFVEYGLHGDHAGAGGLRLLVLTNLAYYVSSSTFDNDVEERLQRLKFDKKDKDGNSVLLTMAELQQACATANYLHQLSQGSFTNSGSFTSLQKLKYADVLRLCLDHTNQMVGIQRHKTPRETRPYNSSLTKVSESFLCRKLGTASRIFSIFRRLCRDDIGRVPLQTRDDCTAVALHKFYALKAKIESVGEFQFHEKLSSHCYVLDEDLHPARALIVWADNGDEGWIFLLNFNQQRWANDYRMLNQGDIAKQSDKVDGLVTLIGDKKFSLKDIETLDFHENHDLQMVRAVVFAAVLPPAHFRDLAFMILILSSPFFAQVIVFKSKGQLTIRFGCAIAHEMWRCVVKIFKPHSRLLTPNPTRFS